MSASVGSVLLAGGGAVPQDRSGQKCYRIEGRAKGDLRRSALCLRSQVFRAGQPDEDAFDGVCDHFVVQCAASATPLGTFRYRASDGRTASQGYTAGHYQLTPRLLGSPSVLEIGRLCLAPQAVTHEVVRLVFAGIARIALYSGAEVIFGCTSFAGSDMKVHAAGLARLIKTHLLPETLRARAYLPAADADPASGVPDLPPLLRTYIAFGARVGPHCVIDRDLDTVHIFTAIETASFSGPGRSALLQLAARL